MCKGAHYLLSFWIFFVVFSEHSIEVDPAMNDLYSPLARVFRAHLSVGFFQQIISFLILLNKFSLIILLTLRSFPNCQKKSIMITVILWIQLQFKINFFAKFLSYVDVVNGPSFNMCSLSNYLFESDIS